MSVSGKRNKYRRVVDLADCQVVLESVRKPLKKAATKTIKSEKQPKKAATKTIKSKKQPKKQKGGSKKSANYSESGRKLTAYNKHIKKYTKGGKMSISEAAKIWRKKKK